MITNEIRSKSRDEIVDEIDESSRELLNLRFQWEAGEVRNSAHYRRTKKNVARLKTILREKELGVNGHLHTDNNITKQKG